MQDIFVKLKSYTNYLSSIFAYPFIAQFHTKSHFFGFDIICNALIPQHMILFDLSHFTLTTLKYAMPIQDGATHKNSFLARCLYQG